MLCLPKNLFFSLFIAHCFRFQLIIGWSSDSLRLLSARRYLPGGVALHPKKGYNLHVHFTCVIVIYINGTSGNTSLGVPRSSHLDCKPAHYHKRSFCCSTEIHNLKTCAVKPLGGVLKFNWLLVEWESVDGRSFTPQIPKV